MRTDLIDVAFEPEEEALDIFGVIGSYNRRSTRIETDRSVPKNTARFCVTYNAKRVEPLHGWKKRTRGSTLAGTGSIPVTRWDL